VICKSRKRKVEKGRLLSLRKIVLQTSVNFDFVFPSVGIGQVG